MSVREVLYSIVCQIIPYLDTHCSVKHSSKNPGVYCGS